MVRPREADRDFVRSVKVELRVRDHQRRRWQEAAKRHGLSLSDWARFHLDRAARAG